MKLYLHAWQHQVLELGKQELVQKSLRCSVEILCVLWQNMAQLLVSRAALKS